MKIVCPECSQKCELGDEYDGVTVECPRCGKEFVARKPVPLIVCPACQGRASVMAEACPHCGHPILPPAPKPSPMPQTVIRPQQPDQPIRVETGENVWSRNRGCVDFLVFGPLTVIVLIIILYGCSKMNGM